MSKAIGRVVRNALCRAGQTRYYSTVCESLSKPEIRRRILFIKDECPTVRERVYNWMGATGYPSNAQKTLLILYASASAGVPNVIVESIGEAVFNKRGRVQQASACPSDGRAHVRM